LVDQQPQSAYNLLWTWYVYNNNNMQIGVMWLRIHLHLASSHSSAYYLTNQYLNNNCFKEYHYFVQGHAVAQCWGTALQTGRSRDRFPMVSLEFFIDIILSAALWLWGRLGL
jgi:hypothetical protein